MIFTMKNIDANEVYDIGISHINVSSGEEMSIRELAFLIKNIVGYQGAVIFDHSMPDGTPRKLLNVDLIKKLGFKVREKVEN